MVSKRKGANERELILLYTKIAEFLEKREEYPDSLEEYKKALEIQKLYRNESDSRLDELLFSIGFILSELGEFTESISYYKDCLNTRMERKDCPPIKLADCYDKLGDSYYNIDERNNAFQAYKNAYDLLVGSAETDPDFLDELREKLAEWEIL